MKLSNYFLPIQKEEPEGASVKSHILMLKAGFIKQTSSGIYAWLPMGLKLLQNIENIIREEINKTGSIEILMPTIQDASIWKESGRFDAYGEEMLKIKDRNGKDMLYGPTNEEMITVIIRSNIQSYKDLPLNLYHMQWKFRDEIRPKNGLLRAREFFMKDGYSFDVDFEGSKFQYNKMFLAYLNIFNKIGLKALPMKADTGAIGGDLSHEFLVLAQSGESEVFFQNGVLNVHNDKNIDYTNKQLVEEKVKEYTKYYLATDETHDFSAKIENLQKAQAIEVGHIFYFADKYSSPLNAKFMNQEGNFQNIFMGSYGIGISRVAAALVESLADDNGMIFPFSVAPFKFVVNILSKKEEDVQKALSCYKFLLNQGVDVLLNDLEDSIGSKLKTAELIGVPYIINFGKTLQDDKVEFKTRQSGDVELIAFGDFEEYLKQIIAKHA